MVYYDDQASPVRHQRLPYDPWDDPDDPPTAPSDGLRQVILGVMRAHPAWGPSRIRADLRHQGYGEVALSAIHGVKAGL